jgi:hypothetical protein
MMALDRVRAPRQARFLLRSCDKRETATSTRKTETTDRDPDRTGLSDAMSVSNER